MEPVASPKQQSIREVRERYERGDIAFDVFQRALDALLAAPDASACQAVVAGLPSSPLAALDGAVVVPARATPLPRHNGTRFIVALVGEARRLRRPWRLAERLTGIAVVGEIALDLSLAALPPRGALRLAAVVGSVTVFVPRTARVTVRSLALVGEITALGEQSSGIVAFGHEESAPEHGGAPAECELMIDAFALVGEVKVIAVDGPVFLASGSRAVLTP